MVKQKLSKPRKAKKAYDNSGFLHSGEGRIVSFFDFLLSFVIYLCFSLPNRSHARELEPIWFAGPFGRIIGFQLIGVCRETGIRSIRCSCFDLKFIFCSRNPV